MTEVSFAKSFLAALDGRPTKLSPDHVEDPKTYPARSAYILPKMPKTMSKRKNASLAPGQERSLDVTVRSLRNPPLDLKMSSYPPNTSIHDIKAAVAERTGIAADKLKILHKKKPVPDSKVLKDLVADDDTAVEFSVMAMGGAAAAAGAGAGVGAGAAKPDAQSDVAQGPSGAEVLQTSDFWEDLNGFLLQRIRDEQLASELTNTFQEAWKARG